nr:actin-binding, cofilin/tropomyosin type [Tanacetum cinerariifolium]
MSDKKDEINKKNERDWSKVERIQDLVDYVYYAKYGNNWKESDEVIDQMLDDLYNFAMMKRSVARLLAENEKLKKENEHLKQTYKDLSDSIKKTSVQTKDYADSLIVQLNCKSVENADLKAQIQEKEAKKKTQDKNKNLKPREMPSAKTHHTPNACIPKPKSNNQTSRNWPASKSCEKTLEAVQKADHYRNPSSFSDFKHFVCSTCQKCVFNANHDACITKFLKEMNSRAKIQPNKTRNSNKPVDPTSHTQKPGRKIVTRHSFSLNKSFVVHEKTNTPRSCLRWIPTGRIVNIAGLKRVLTGKTFTSSTTMVDCEPPNGKTHSLFAEKSDISEIKGSRNLCMMKGQWMLINSDQLPCFMIMACADNTSGTVP